MCWEKHHLTTFPSRNFLFITMKHEISADVHFNVSLRTILPISSDRLTENRGTVGITCNLQQYAAGYISSRLCNLRVIHFIVTCSLLYIPQYFPLSLLCSSPFPQHQVMAPQRLQPGMIQSESSRTTGASSNAPMAETQQQRRHQLVHCNAAIAATENMAQDAYLETVRITGRSDNGQQYSIGCE